MKTRMKLTDALVVVEATENELQTFFSDPDIEQICLGLKIQIGSLYRERNGPELPVFVDVFFGRHSCGAIIGFINMCSEVTDWGQCEVWLEKHGFSRNISNKRHFFSEQFRHAKKRAIEIYAQQQAEEMMDEVISNEA